MDLSKIKDCFWYLSPWRVFSFFLEEWKDSRAYYMALSYEEKKEIRRRQFYRLSSFLVSLVLHIILFFSVVNFFTAPPDEENFQEILVDNIIDFELTMGMITSVDIGAVYDVDSNVIIRPHALVKSDKPGAQEKILDDLLGQLKDEKLSIWSKSKGSQLNHGDFNLSEDMKKKIESEFNIQVRKRKADDQKVALAQLWNRLKLSQINRKRGGMNDKYIMDEIQKHMDQFRDCYEKSLLREDELSIKATFFVNIRKTVVKKAKINLTGRGSMSIKKQLSRCLLKEINQISFLKNKQDMPVRFSLLFDL